MDANVLFSKALGLGSGWKVVKSEMDVEGRELKLWLDFEPGNQFKEFLEAAPAAVWWLLLGAFCGAGGALLFWFVAIRGLEAPGPRLSGGKVSDD